MIVSIRFVPTIDCFWQKLTFAIKSNVSSLVTLHHLHSVGQRPITLALVVKDWYYLLAIDHSDLRLRIQIIFYSMFVFVCA